MKTVAMMPHSFRPVVRREVRRLSRILALLGFCWLMPADIVIAQDDKEASSSETSHSLTWREQVDRPVLGFATGPAGLLLTPQESIEFESLVDRTKRLLFVEKLWFDVSKNCPPDVNPLRDEFWRRADAAEVQFPDEGIPGWMTDRGRAFLMLGEPTATVDGTVTIAGQTYTAEFWTFEDSGEGPKNVVFVKLPLGWKIAGIDTSLTDVSSATLDADAVPSIEEATLSLARRFRSQGCELTAEQIAENAQLGWRRSLWESTGALIAGQMVEADSPFVPQAYFFPAQEGATFTMLTVPLDSEPAAGERVVAMLRHSTENEVAYVFGSDDHPFETRKTGGAVVAQAARALPPGRYRAVAGIVDGEGQLTTRYAGEQIVARLLENDLRMTSVIVADELKPSGEETEPKPFELGGFEVVPRIGNDFRAGDELNIFYQVIGASKAASGAADLTVSYQLYGKPPSREWVKIGQAQSSKEPGAVRVWSLPISPQFRPAEYKLEIAVVDNPTGKRVTKELPFRVVAP